MRFISDDYAQGGGSQQYYAVSAGATWRLNRSLSLIGSYSFRSRQSSNSIEGTDTAAIVPYDQVVGSNYTENVILLRVRFAL